MKLVTKWENKSNKVRSSVAYEKPTWRQKFTAKLEQKYFSCDAYHLPSRMHVKSSFAFQLRFSGIIFFYLTDHFFCRQIVSAAGKNNRNNWNFYFFAVLFPFFLCIFFCRFFANFPATDIRNKKAWLANFFYFIYSRVSEFCENVFFFAKFWIALKFIQISFYRPRTVSLDA